MASVRKISRDTKEDLARQIGEQLMFLAPDAVQGKTVELRDDFAMWRLKKDSLELIVDKSENELGKLSELSDRWHHQIIADGQPIAFARSIAQEGSSLRTVVDLILSPIAKHIESAIEWLESEVDQDPDDARLLPIPSLYLHTFWVIEESRHRPDVIVVADSPREQRQFKQRAKIRPSEFIENIRRSVPLQVPRIAHQVARKAEQRILELSEPSIRKGDLSRIFARWGFKRLSSHEVDPNTSHGHEFQGIGRLMHVLGVPVTRQTKRVIVAYLGASPEEPAQVQFGAMTWYNAREGKPRNPEYRLYYTANLSLIQKHATPGDLMLLAVDFEDNMMMLIAPQDSTVAQQLHWLFDDHVELSAEARHSVHITGAKVIGVAKRAE